MLHVAISKFKTVLTNSLILILTALTSTSPPQKKAPCRAGPAHNLGFTIILRHTTLGRTCNILPFRNNSWSIVTIASKQEHKLSTTIVHCALIQNINKVPNCFTQQQGCTYHGLPNFVLCRLILWALNMKLVSCLPYGSYNLEVVH